MSIAEEARLELDALYREADAAQCENGERKAVFALVVEACEEVMELISEYRGCAAWFRIRLIRTRALVRSR